MVLREALALALIGILVGLPMAMALGRVAKAQLYGIDSFDMTSVGGAILLLVIVSAIAATIPARRASRMDPVAALRGD
jgi:ABC-type antimicrobial peptide transport system permease subunit